MGFVCTAAGTDSSIELIKDSIIIPIGYDDSEPKSYSLIIGFDVMAGGDTEFYFCIAEANHTENTETRHWSGLDVAKFASKEDRLKIRATLLYGAERLLNHKSPPRVFCCTRDSNLPEKALMKHLLIAQTFKTCGYQVERMPKQLGKHSWWMELQPQSSVTN